MNIKLLTILLLIINQQLFCQDIKENFNEKIVNTELEKVIKEFANIKVGMKRIELMKLVATEGGLSNRSQRTFIHIKYPFIKIDVKFLTNIAPDNQLTENNNDVINEVSKPYLQLQISD